jgi:hypothetical protein
MSLVSHLRFLSLASVAWLAFWVAGLPEYYRQYSETTMLRVVVLLLPPLTWVVVHTLRRVHQRRRMQVALWIAFYFTVPLALYDGIYCGLYRGYGLTFVVEFWYLTVYYIIPWLLLPASAGVLNRMDAMPGRGRHEKHRSPG